MLLASDAEWFARSIEDVTQLRDADEGAYAKLSDDEFYAFRDGLQFKDGGLVTGSYRPLMSSMTLTDIFEVFERFGMSRGHFQETLEAECVGGQCEFSFWSFCASNCGSLAE